VGLVRRLTRRQATVHCPCSVTCHDEFYSRGKELRNTVLVSLRRRDPDRGLLVFGAGKEGILLSTQPYPKRPADQRDSGWSGSEQVVGNADPHHPTRGGGPCSDGQLPRTASPVAKIPSLAPTRKKVAAHAGALLGPLAQQREAWVSRKLSLERQQCLALHGTVRSGVAGK
jgi:hypothetical protein